MSTIPRGTLRDTLLSCRRTGDPTELVALVPYCTYLGLTAHLDGDQIVTSMRYHDALIGNPTVPALHGGTIGALLESAAIFQAAWEAEPASFPKTITLTIDYLRSGKPMLTHARARIAKRGRRVLSVHAEAYQDHRDKPITSAVVHLLVPGSRDHEG
jgi:uncharacterized protein (TIGR00369 family)